MRKINPERERRRLEEGLVYSDHHAWIATQPCVLAGLQGHECVGIVCGHHLRSVGSGGEDRRNEVPVCVQAHAEFHAVPLSVICRQYHRDFKSLANEYTEAFDQLEG